MLFLCCFYVILCCFYVIFIIIVYITIKIKLQLYNNKYFYNFTCERERHTLKKFCLAFYKNIFFINND